MKMHMLRRIAAALSLSALMLTGIAAQAQEALPAPQAASQNAPRVAPDLVSPLTFLDASTLFSWSQVGADAYTVTAKVVRTGQTFKFPYNAPLTCVSGYCYGYNGSMSLETLFLATQTGDQVIVSATAFFGNVKVKGPKHTVTVRETEKSTLVSPAADALLGEAPSFTWNAPSYQTFQLLVVKDVITGQKTSVNVFGCMETCSTDSIVPGFFVTGHTYKWFVRTNSYYPGESVKSAKRTFTLANVR